MLGLYDAAAALISVDTVHLHLSKASRVPVFALARYFPKRWHGTPQLPRFTWHCRYGEVLERVDEMIQTLREVFATQMLCGRSQEEREVGLSSPTSLNEKQGWKALPPFREPLAIPRGAYNPSIIEH